MQQTVSRCENALSVSLYQVGSQPVKSHFRDLSLAARIDLFSKILASSFRRFLWRIRGIRVYEPVDFGSALRRQADGSLLPNERTDFRIQSIEALLAKYPWADSEDARMFLEGFDAAEAWILRTEGK